MEQAAPGRGFSLKHVQAVLDLARPGAAGHLDLARLQVERRNESLWLNRRASGPVPGFDHPLTVPGAVEVPEAGMTITASRVETLGTAGLGSGRGDWATVQAGPEKGPWTVRNRHPGDRFWPLGAPGHRKLHDLFIDRKIPRQARDRVPIVVDASGQIVWVVGLTIAHGYRVTMPRGGVVVLEAWRKPE
jgi:tRNA(Ile)-lysidine synthase